MIDAQRLIPSEPFFVFYGNTDSPDGALHHTGDDPTGKQCRWRWRKYTSRPREEVDYRVTEILFVVTIHDALNRKQNCGQVRNSYIRIVDNANGEEVAKYEWAKIFYKTAVEFGRLYKHNNKWKFEASGIGYKEDLAFFLSKYYKGEIIK